jgi:branched-chain amino acid aminotransferase
LQVARDWGFEVEERKISVFELIDLLREGKLDEAFGAGTAATIAHIKLIHCDGVDYTLPPVENREFSNKVGAYLNDLKYGRIPDEHGWNVGV